MSNKHNTSLIDSFKKAIEVSEVKVSQLVTNHPDYYPLYTMGGKWHHSGDHWTKWGDGYLPGQMWLLYELTGKKWWREKAEHYSVMIESRKNERDIQSHWSLFWPTYKKWWDITGDNQKYQVLETAAESLASRYNSAGGYLKSFVGAHSNLIDNMMSVILIFFIAHESKNKRLMDIAETHAITAMRFLVRGDGSAAHEAVFNPETGEFLRTDTHQGYRRDSSWSRGQAWVIYGFSHAYRYSRNRKFLETAKRGADFFLERTEAYPVPPNDFEEPEPKYRYESSAGAAAAAGMLHLCEELKKENLYYRPYEDASLEILQELCSQSFLAAVDEEWDGILKHGIYHLDKELGVDESMIWGDYFFLEALKKVLK